MRILALESSCDETAAAVVENGRKVLSSVIASQVEEHKLYGGVVPEIASRRHCEAIVGVTQKALEDAGMELDYTELRVLGRTRDDAAGEAFDKAARAMGMPYPGGVEMDRRAQGGNPDAFQLPHPVVDGSPYDFSFSGLKTAVINLIHNAEQKGERLPVEDLAASFRKAVVDCLVKNFIQAAEDTGSKKLVIAGGVSANSLLRSRLEDECKKRDWSFFRPDLKLCGDNAAMVGAQGYYEFLKNNLAKMDLNACAAMPVDA